MNTTTERKVANVIGGKTARACESCLKKRARWFCTADDAFLCQSCDAIVHSANQLASRHERVRLKTTSSSNKSSPPAWHQGFTKKARTPRHNKNYAQSVKSKFLVTVPETNEELDVFWEENEEEEEDKFLNFRVPVLDPFDHKGFCSDDHDEGIGGFLLGGDEEESNCHDLNIEELMSCDLELSEFNVEDLLGNERNGIVDEVAKIEELDDDELMNDEVQAVIECHFDPALDMDLSFDFDYAAYNSTSNGEEEEDTTTKVITTNENSVESESQINEKRMLLRLNHEVVIAAWATQGSPWTNGVRPDPFNLDEFTAACLGGGSCDPYGLGGRRSGANDARRRERVSRYREKRRTRLFSKKIRYEVRKLNAEKRPRMKGRFVKRTSVSECSLPNYSL